MHVEIDALGGVTLAQKQNDFSTDADLPSFDDGASLENLDSLLEELDISFPPESQPQLTEHDSQNRKENFPEKAGHEEPLPRKPHPDKAPGGFVQFVTAHHVAINICLALLCLVLIAGIAAVILLEGNPDPLGGKIMENVFVAGVDVGGMSKAQACNAVNAAISSNYSSGTMVVELGSSQLMLSSSQTHPTLQVQAAVDAAYSYGRTGSASERQRDYREAQFAPKQTPVEPYFGLNTDYIRSTVSDFISGFSDEYSPSGYTLEGEKPALDAEGFDKTAPCQTLVLEVGNPGSDFDLDGICRSIYQGYQTGNFHVVVPSEYLPQFPEKLDIDDIYQQLHVDPVEAVEKPGSNEVIPGSCGYTFSLEDARAQLASADYGQTISISMEYILPNKLDSNGSFTESLSRYNTAVSSNETYNYNMKLLCKQLDGLVLEPGENFSFNVFLSDRSVKAGYKAAPRHGDNCFDEVVCGGADQVATTLYVAAMTADLTVSEKYAGDHLCDYTTKGTEISVTGDWQDLKLVNSLKTPVKIRAKVTEKQVIIEILGEKPLDYYIKLETKEGYPIQHGTVLATRKSSDGFTNGQVLVEGIDGCQVILYRVKIDKTTNAEISRATEYAESRPRSTVLVNVTG